jgi:hypothetical protein
MIPFGLFVWTIKDAFDLCILAVLAGAVLVYLIVLGIDSARRAWKRRE